MVEVGVRLLIARKTAFANLRFEKSEDSSSIGAEELGVVGTVAAIDILAGAMKREHDSLSVYKASYEDLTKLVQSYFAELKEKVETENIHVLVANVGTFYQDENGQMAITH